MFDTDSGGEPPTNDERPTWQADRWENDSRRGSARAAELPTESRPSDDGFAWVVPDARSDAEDDADRPAVEFGPGPV